ncbi:MAG: hypothetical protein AAGA06_05440 [Pseudomonadota bacterium]
MVRILDWVSPRGIMRLLVISYFVASALGWIAGSAMVDFMIPVLPDDIATMLMRGLILVLSVLVLVGIGRRHAALVLALVVFFSSYTNLYAGGDIGNFWRDLALIGALLMTADFAKPKEGDEDAGWIDLDDTAPGPRVPSRPPEPDITPLDDKQFREDLDIARAT